MNRTSITAGAIIAGSLIIFSACAARRGAPLDHSLRWAEKVTRTERNNPQESAAPVYHDGSLYLSLSDGSFSELDPVTGKVRRAITALDGPLETTPVIADGLAYIGSDGGGVYAIDLAEMKIAWQYPVANEILSEITIKGDRLYFSTNNDTAQCLDRKSGKFIWRYSTNAPLAELTVRGAAGVAVDDDGKAYLGLSSGRLVAVSDDDGSQLWSVKLADKTEFNDVDSTPVVFGDLVIAAGFNGRLYGVNRNTAEIEWSFNRSSAIALVLDSDRVYYSAYDGRVYAIDAKTGHVVWETAMFGGMPTRASVFRSRIYVISDTGVFHTLDRASGRVLDLEVFHTAEFTAPAGPSPLGVFLLSDNGWLYRVRETLAWRRHPADQ